MWFPCRNITKRVFYLHCTVEADIDLVLGVLDFQISIGVTKTGKRVERRVRGELQQHQAYKTRAQNWLHLEGSLVSLSPLAHLPNVHHMGSTKAFSFFFPCIYICSLQWYDYRSQPPSCAVHAQIPLTRLPTAALAQKPFSFLSRTLFLESTYVQYGAQVALATKEDAELRTAPRPAKRVRRNYDCYHRVTLFLCPAALLFRLVAHPSAVGQRLRRFIADAI